MTGGQPYQMLTDPGIRAFMVASDLAYPPDAVSFTPAEQREFYDLLCSRFSPPHPAGLRVTDRRVATPSGPVAIRIYRPASADLLPAVFFLHGGGFVVGSLDSHDSVCAEIAARANAGLIAVDYRLAPEHRFPAAFDDCWSVLCAIAEIAREHDLDASRIVLAGDSAGANLAAGLCIRARDEAAPAIAGQVLIYPALAADTSSASYREHANAPGLSTADVEYYHQVYIGAPGTPNRSSKFAHPLCETDYSRLPPAFLVAAEWDPLRDDAFAYAARLQAAGVTAEVRHEPLLVHGFLRARHMSKPAAESFNAITGAISMFAHHGRHDHLNRKEATAIR